ncbi:MAG: MFS transporter [Chloroflexi bacterium]|nr:MFS transporter [Chloroflexota bacterium]
MVTGEVTPVRAGDQAEPIRMAGFARFWPAPFRQKQYRRIFSAGLISYHGRFIDITLIAWMVVQSTDSPLAITMVTTFRFLPFLLIGPFIGVALDRLPLLRILRTAQVGSITLAIAMAVAVSVVGPELALLYAYSFANGITWTLEMSTRRAFIRRSMGSRAVTSGIALELLAWYVGSMIGSNIAGSLITKIPNATTFLAIAALYALSAALMLAMKDRTVGITERSIETPLAQFRDGVRVALRSRVLLMALILVGTANMFGFGFEALTPLFAVDVLDSGAVGLGLLISASGIGAIIGTLIIASLAQNTTRQGLLFIIATAGLHVSSMAFASAPNFIGAFIVLIGAGVIANLFGVMSGALIIVSAPKQAYGRIIGLHIAVIGMFPIGSAMLGLLANEFGPRMALVTMASIGLSITLIVALMVPELRARTIPEEDR